jgi:hypothetical protein
MRFSGGSRQPGLPGRLRWTATSAGAVAVAVMGLAPAVAATHQAHRAASPAPVVAQPPGAVSPHPESGTPELVKTDPTGKQVIRQLVQCGGTMYAVGSFSEISQNGTPVTRHNIFSFKATSPYTLTSWSPNVNGEVNSIALSSDCAHAYIGGTFTNVTGTSVQNIAEIRTDNGTVVTRWLHKANGEVDTLLRTPNGHLLAGGKFTSINGSSAAPYFASLSLSSGNNDGFLNLKISGHYHYCDPSTGKCSITFPTQVYNQQLSHNGALDLAEGVFTSVGGLPRQQIFMLNLATSPASVTGWTSPEWDGSKGNLPGGYPYQCWFTESFYIRAAAWSPGDSTIYTATTGFHPWNQPTGTFPRTGLCDSTAAWPATQSSVLHEWINYTGCDSLFSAAADNGAVYVAGHPRWGNNPDGCNLAGTNAVPDQGLQGHSLSTGRVLVNASGNAIYSMSRANADDMLITGAGLWIASTDRFGASFCGSIGGHSGICFLRY